MQLLLTSDQMRACDKEAIRTYGIQGLLLMENAGRAVAETAREMLKTLDGKTIFIFCGTGNNGGDGFVAARHLIHYGTKVHVYVMGKKKAVHGDAKVNLRILEKFIRDKENKLLLLNEFRSTKQFPKADLVIDALLGTGFKGKLRPTYRRVIEWINKSGIPCLAIDLPSGVDANSGSAADSAIRADVTVTMAQKKIGLVLGAGRQHAGRVLVADIGIPRRIYEEEKSATYLVNSNDIRNRLPRRLFDAHKHNVGKIFVLAGSPGLTGAAALTSSAAMRSGAGAVVLGTPRSIYPILSKKLTEVMVHPLPDTSAGSLSLSGIAEIEKYSAWADVIVIGPGLSTQKETQELILSLLRTSKKPMLIDADALNVLANDISALKKNRHGHFILTPHIGELSRLIKVPARKIENDRPGIARTKAKEWNTTLVAKGAPTLVASSNGTVFINSTGNPGMATAGSGDVLSGIIATLWAQGLNSEEAGYCGVYIHGLAGDCAREKYGERSLLASDLIHHLPMAFDQIEKRSDTT